MKAKIENGDITISVEELVYALSKEDVARVARMVAAKEHLFAAVLECVSSERRNGNYFTDDPDGEWWFDPRSLLDLREKLLPLMSDIARGAVTEALRQRDVAREEEARTRDWAWRLYHAWPDGRWDSRPSHPSGYVPPAERAAAEIDALLLDRTA